MTSESYKVAVVGIGRLGLCLALVLDDVGYDVIGIDVNVDYINKINNKTLKSNEPCVSDMLKKSDLTASIDLKDVKDAEIIFVCVATPSTMDYAYDTDSMGKVLQNLSKIVENREIIIVATVLPGYTINIAKYLIPNNRLVYSPEFIAQGDIVRGLYTPDIVLIGDEQAGFKEKDPLKVVDVYKAMSKNNPKFHILLPTEAEIAKLSINCFITTKISYANMIGDILDATNFTNEGTLDKFRVLRAIGDDSRIGNKYLKPGFGFGGPCFPRDNRALDTFAKSVGIDAMISKVSDRYNNYHAEVLANKINSENPEKIIFLDPTYKENCDVDIIEESHKLKVAEKLSKKGSSVTIQCTRKSLLDMVQRKYGNLFNYNYELVDK